MLKDLRSKQEVGSLTNGFSAQKRFQDFRETSRISQLLVSFEQTSEKRWVANTSFNSVNSDGKREGLRDKCKP